jgi:hypothetical protein
MGIQVRQVGSKAKNVLQRHAEHDLTLLRDGVDVAQAALE